MEIVKSSHFRKKMSFMCNEVHQKQKIYLISSPTYEAVLLPLEVYEKLIKNKKNHKIANHAT